jgi:proteasome lid subunit RPN8/RPN11
MSARPFRLLHVPEELFAEMVRHAEAEAPLECCGLLAGMAEGEGGRVLGRYPLINAAASPVEYLSEPRAMFEAFRDMRGKGWDVLAVYHSHPTSAPVPSRTDLARNYSPEVVNLIVSLSSSPPTVRGWWLTESEYEEAEWEVGPGAPG